MGPSRATPVAASCVADAWQARASQPDPCAWRSSGRCVKVRWYVLASETSGSGVCGCTSMAASRRASSLFSQHLVVDLPGDRGRRRAGAAWPGD